MDEELEAYFRDVFFNQNTLNLDSWIDSTGYPYQYNNGRIHNIIPTKLGEVNQSIYISNNEKLLMDITSPSYNIAHDIAISYKYETNMFSMDYVNSEDYDDAELCGGYVNKYSTIKCKLFSSEEEYFQESTIQKLFFTYEEQIKLKNFFDGMYNTFCQNKVRVR